MEMNSTLSKLGLITTQTLTFLVPEDNLPAVRIFTQKLSVLQTTESNNDEGTQFTVVAQSESGFRDLQWLRGGIASLIKSV